MSRSKFVVAVLVVLSILLTNCAPAQPTAVPPTAVPSKPWAGKTINILMEGVPDTEYIQALLSQWEQQSGMKVNIEVLNYALMHERLVPQLTSPAGGGSYDVIVVDNYWVGEFVKAGWLATLDDRLAKSTSVKKDAYLKSMWDMVGQVDNVTYMIPFYNYAMGLIYRTDLLADPQLQAAYKTKFGKDLAIPATVADYVELLKFMTRDTNGDGKVDIYGSSMMGLRPDPIMMEWLNYLYSVGGDLYDASWKPIVNNEAGLTAAALYLDAMKNAAPPGSPSYGFDEAFNVMAQGGAFSFLTFNWMIPKLNDPNTSQVVGKVQIAPMPGGKGLLGGWGWALPKSAPNPDAGWAFIEWVESFPIAKARALAGGAPTRADVFDDAEVLAKYPHYALVKQLVQECVMLPIISRTPQLVEILGREMSEAVAGNKQAKDALDAAARDLATIVD